MRHGGRGVRQGGAEIHQDTVEKQHLSLRLPPAMYAGKYAGKATAPAQRGVRRIVNTKPTKAAEIPFLSAWDQHRLWAKITKGEPQSCWHWTGARSGFGYGRFKVAGKLHSPHRLVYALKVGKIVNVAEHHGSVVMHTCDNPACCNPAHLTLGRQIDNANDMAAKGRCGGASHLNGRTRPAEALSPLAGRA